MEKEQNKPRLWLDTNILIDFLTQRADFGKDASKIFLLAEESKLEIYISILSFVNAHYILRGKHYKISSKDIKQVFETLTKYVKVSGHESQDLKKALESNFEDFEDAIQYFSVENLEHIDFIISRNIDDFQETNISILTPKEFLEQHNNF